MAIFYFLFSNPSHSFGRASLTSFTKSKINKSLRMRFFTEFKIKSSCAKIGEDEFGNQYFQNKIGKRFVIYKGIAEPSKIPAQWHGWMHYSTNQVPANSKSNHYSWQKIHLPNLTGTKNSYAPKGHLAQGGLRDKVSADYESWNPEKPTK